MTECISRRDDRDAASGAPNRLTARATLSASPPAASWKAELELWFAPAAGKTRLARRRHLGPLMVQSPFHPEKDGTCHVYVLHPPGGVAGGDELALQFHLAPAARALLTTPGATKFYCTRSGLSRQVTEIDVADGGMCEYFPQETILFDGAQAEVVTEVDLAGSAGFAGWDFFCLGRPAADERFATGRLRQRIEIRRDGRPLWVERSNLAGGSPMLGAAHALAGHTTWGTMVYVAAGPDSAAERVRAALGEQGRGRFSVSCLAEVVVCRYLGPHAAEGKALFARAWGVLRNLSQGKAASPPRIWAT